MKNSWTVPLKMCKVSYTKLYTVITITLTYYLWLLLLNCYDFFLNFWKFWKFPNKFFGIFPTLSKTLLSETDRNFAKFTETDRKFAKQISSFGANPNITPLWEQHKICRLIFQYILPANMFGPISIDMEIDGRFCPYPNLSSMKNSRALQCYT